MKTLIVHPEDSTTDFLKVVYEKIPNQTVITGGISYLDLNKLVGSHDSVILLGHGTPEGLSSVGQFLDANRFIIDYRMVEPLKLKKQCLFVWCNADWFVEVYHLAGFYTGMFISEVAEAWSCGLTYVSLSMVEESNFEFSRIMSTVVQEDPRSIYKRVRVEYRKVGKRNPVALFNWQRLFFRL